MPAKSSRLLLGLTGLLVAGMATFAGGWYWYGSSGNNAANEQTGPSGADADVVLDPEQREHIWQIEHHVLVLGKQWFHDLGSAWGRADAAASGQQDIVVRKSGGGPLTSYENQLPPRHDLEVTLRGRQSNRLGIGARLVAETAAGKLTRELYPVNSYFSQMPARVHFGLGDAARVDRLTIRWPSGQVQVLDGLAADRHVVIEEGLQGGAAVETVVPGKLIQP
jgi:hypothetical protein